MNQLGRSLASGAGGNTRWGSLGDLASSGASEDLQHDIPRCTNYSRFLSLGVVTDDGTLCDICWQCSTSVGATGLGGAEATDLACLQEFNQWIRNDLSHSEVARLISDGARIYFGGQRSAIAQQRNRLRIMAKKAEDRCNRWCAAGCPPARECRLVGEPDDDCPLYHPLRD
eukprot:1222221-Pyramimonas_sp.AAC.1